MKEERIQKIIARAGLASGEAQSSFWLIKESALTASE